MHRIMKWRTTNLSRRTHNRHPSATDLGPHTLPALPTLLVRLYHQQQQQQSSSVTISNDSNDSNNKKRMNRNVDAVSSTNTNSDQDPDFKTFWKQLHKKGWVAKIVFTPQCPQVEQTDCYSVTPKRMEHWSMAIEVGFTFDDLESMVERHKHVALSPRVILSASFLQGCGRIRIRSLYLEFGTIDQFEEEDKEAIRFVLRLAAEHSLKSPFDGGIRLTQCFVEMKQLHDIPLVTHCVKLDSCDVVGCDKLMFNISQNSKYVGFYTCKLANGGADLCRWLSPNNCSVTEVSFYSTRITCDTLAKLFQSNKRINKLNIDFGWVHRALRIYSQQEINQIIKLLSDASHLKKLRVADIWDGSSRQEQMIRFDALISLLGNKSLSSLIYSHSTDPNMFEVPPEIFSAQIEALEQALEQTTQLIHLDIDPRPPGEHGHVYNALVERTLRRNYRNKMRSMLRSLLTWSRPQALFGEMLMRTSKRWGPMGSTNETFHILLQCSDMLKQIWDDRIADEQRPDTTGEIALK